MKNEAYAFIKGFIQDPNTVGSVYPSSGFLCNSMLKKIDFLKAEVVVELGAGTGIITKEILKRKSNNTQFIAIEINSRFYREFLQPLEAENVHIINDRAENLLNCLTSLKIDNVDCIICSLPFTVLPELASKKILFNVHQCLPKGGSFVCYQYSLYYLDYIKKLFSNVEVGFQPINIPPAFIYYCRK